MFSDDKIRKLLDGIPDRIEKGIEKLDQELDEFDRSYEETKKRMDDFDNELKRDIANSRFLKR